MELVRVKRALLAVSRGLLQEVVGFHEPATSDPCGEPECGGRFMKSWHSSPRRPAVGAFGGAAGLQRSEGSVSYLRSYVPVARATGQVYPCGWGVAAPRPIATQSRL